MQSKRFMLIGFGLLVLGFVLPFLMLLQVIPSTLLLNFISYGASLVGLIIGFLGTVLYVHEHRRKE